METEQPRYSRRAIAKGVAGVSLTGLVFLTAPGPSLGRGSRDKDCGDFKSQKQAQRFFRRHQPGDPHRLDGDHDGRACESLP